MWDKLTIAQRQRVLRAARLNESLSFVSWDWISKQERKLIESRVYAFALLNPMSDPEAAA